jgi:hypothetical protein
MMDRIAWKSLKLELRLGWERRDYWMRKLAGLILEGKCRLWILRYQ